MAVALVRVDDRLIHGQVVVGWMPALGANSILVINDAVAADPLQRNLLPLAVPPDISVRISRVSDAIEALLDCGQDEEDKVIVLFANPVDVLNCVKAGAQIRRLNLGGMRFGPGKTQVDPAISLGSEDIAALHGLKKIGISVSIQMVPDEKPRDIFEIIPGG